MEKSSLLGSLVSSGQQAMGRIGGFFSKKKIEEEVHELRVPDESST
jgi:hypothetical protein